MQRVVSCFIMLAVFLHLGWGCSLHHFLECQALCAHQHSAADGRRSPNFNASSVNPDHHCAAHHNRLSTNIDRERVDEDQSSGRTHCCFDQCEFLPVPAKLLADSSTGRFLFALMPLAHQPATLAKISNERFNAPQANSKFELRDQLASRVLQI